MTSWKNDDSLNSLEILEDIENNTVKDDSDMIQGKTDDNHDKSSEDIQDFENNTVTGISVLHKTVAKVWEGGEKLSKINNKVSVSLAKRVEDTVDKISRKKNSATDTKAILGYCEGQYF